MAAISAGIDSHKTETGTMHVSGAELTALDLFRYPDAVGSIDAIATVMNDLASKINAVHLASLARACERSVVQRLGYLLDRLGNQESAELMHADLYERGRSLPWIELERKPGDSKNSPPALERNERWHVVVKRYPEVDE